MQAQLFTVPLTHCVAFSGLTTLCDELIYLLCACVVSIFPTGRVSAVGAGTATSPVPSTMLVKSYYVKIYWMNGWSGRGEEALGLVCYA